jgi:nitroimidazol reductase NimA-like FMN-containing flavoprotein (pyridoxamine 5'-phosphate oxidase superfamily)
MPSTPTELPSAEFVPTDRTRVRRLAKRGSFDRELAYSIIDTAITCHVGFAIEGRPWVIPTIHTRVGDDLYLHGAPANHMLNTLADGVETCVTMTLVDALVLARSAFHHSINYRSVMVFGRAQRVDDTDEQQAAFAALVEHVVPGRGADARPPTAAEMRKTLLLKLPISEASAKVRTGGPVDDEEDVTMPIWAGVVPVSTEYGAPLADVGITAAPPAYITQYARP